VSFHVETLFPAQVCVQRQTILAAAIFLQRRQARHICRNAPKEIPSSVRSDIFRYATPPGLEILLVGSKAVHFVIGTQKLIHPRSSRLE
jgi:hypothetical protein